MSNKPQYIVPASLIEELGTGTDTLGLIGKKIRITHVPKLGELAALLGLEAPYYEGAEGTVVHVTADGDYWADFGEDPNVRLQGPEDDQRRLWDFGNADGRPRGNEDDPVTYEVLEDEGAGFTQQAA